jgi:hypothetical protein
VDLIAFQQSHVTARIFTGKPDAMPLKERLKRKHRSHRAMIHCCAGPIQKNSA